LEPIQKKLIYELPQRSLVKSITFRIFVLISDTVIVSTITGQISETLTIVIFTNLFSTVLYYIHERIWVEWKWLLKIFSNNHINSPQLTKSMVKAISFRIIVLSADLFVTSKITGSTTTALSIIIFTNLGSTIVYYFHEILWNSIKWGKQLH